MSTLLSTTLVAMAVTFVAVLVFSRLAKRLGLLDIPDLRKAHARPTPMVGGLAIVMAMLASAVLLNWLAVWPGLAMGLSLMFIVGLADDRLPIRARWRFIAQAGAAALLVLVDGTVVAHLDHVFAPGTLSLGWLAVPFSLVCIMGVVNAYNMSDGADGLCGGYVLIAVGGFSLAGLLSATEASVNSALFELTLPLSASILTFLWFNMRHPWRARAAVFLGDGGSMMLGLLVASLAITSTSGATAGQNIPAVTVLWMVLLPVADMFACMIRRVFLDKVTPMTADRKHMHHLLMKKGMGVAGAVRTLHGLSLAGVLIGLAGWQFGVPHFVMFWLLIASFFTYLLYSLTFWGEALPSSSMDGEDAEGVTAS